MAFPKRIRALKWNWTQKQLPANSAIRHSDQERTQEERGVQIQLVPHRAKCAPERKVEKKPEDYVIAKPTERHRGKNNLQSFMQPIKTYTGIYQKGTETLHCNMSIACTVFAFTQASINEVQEKAQSPFLKPPHHHLPILLGNLNEIEFFCVQFNTYCTLLHHHV